MALYSKNKAIVLGRVGGDPEIRTTQNGNKVATFSVATSEGWKDKQTGEWKEKTEWHRITVWNEGLIGIIEKHVGKGDRVQVEGQLQTRKYEKDGVERQTTEIVLPQYGGELQLLTDKHEGSGETSRPAPSQARKPDGVRQRHQDMDDEIPF